MVTDLTENVSWQPLITSYRIDSCSHSMITMIISLKKGGDLAQKSTQI